MTTGATVIVPAYNEAPRIGNVLRVLLQSELFDQVIAVDDGSRDQTPSVIRQYPVTFRAHKENRGKAAALQSGLECASKADIVAFIDADLTGLTVQHLRRLLQPLYDDDQALMSIAQFTRAHPGIDAVQKWFAILNGQRALHRSFIDQLPNLSPLRFGVEVFLTRYARDLGVTPTRVYWPGVSHIMKEQKYGLIPGFLGRLNMYKEVLSTFFVTYPRWSKKQLQKMP